MMEEEEWGGIESGIQQAMRCRIQHSSEQAKILSRNGADDKNNSKDVGENTLEEVKKEEAELPEEQKTKEDVKELNLHEEEKIEDSTVIRVLTGNKSSKSENLEAQDNENNEIPSEATVDKAIWKRATYFRAKSEEITSAGVRRILEEDLQLDKYTLDPLKNLISKQIVEVLNFPMISKFANPVKKKSSLDAQSKTSKKTSSIISPDSPDSERDDEEPEETTKKKFVTKGKIQKSEGIKKCKRPAKEAPVPRKKQSRLSEEAEQENSDKEYSGVSSDDGRSRSSTVKTVKRKEVLPPAYGKQVKHLKSKSKSCGVSIAPSVYKKAKQVPDDKSETFVINELEEILSKERLSADSSEKDRTMRNMPTASSTRKVRDEQLQSEQLLLQQQQEDSELQVGTFPFPGGPLEPTVLRNYANHIAAHIWNGIERSLLRVINHKSKLLEWPVTCEHVSPQWTTLIERSSIAQLRRITYEENDKVLISAFIERWHSETNTFHLPFGEMTITLDDVWCLTALPIEGKTVFLENKTVRRAANDEDADESKKNIICRYFGVPIELANEGMEGARRPSVKLEWLREHFSQHCNSADEGTLSTSVRAYLLYMLGCTTFADKTGNRVTTSLLEFLDDVDDIHTYSWGSATLAFLYKQLGDASRQKTKQLAGYVSLLEAWIYVRFPMFRPPHNVNYCQEWPAARRYESKKSVGLSETRLVAIREQIDLLKASEIDWLPYKSMRTHYPFHPISLYSGCIGALEIVEPYHPDRVLRQFGNVQRLPELPIAHDIIDRGILKNRRLLNALVQYFRVWDSHILSDDRRGETANPPWACVPHFMEWYRRVSHPMVSNPEHRSNYVSTTANPSLPDPWDMIGLARGLLQPVYDRYRSGDLSIGYEEWGQAVQGAFVYLNGPDKTGSFTHDGPFSGIGPSTVGCASSILASPRNKED